MRTSTQLIRIHQLLIQIIINMFHFTSMIKYQKKILWLSNVDAHAERFCIMVHFSQKASNPRSSLNLYRAVPQSFITKAGHL